MMVGAMLWWLGLSYVVNKVRTHFNEKYIRMMTMTIGALVIMASLFGFVFTLLGLHSIY